jgi:hypothetical protein
MDEAITVLHQTRKGMLVVKDNNKYLIHNREQPAIKCNACTHENDSSINVPGI